MSFEKPEEMECDGHIYDLGMAILGLESLKRHNRDYLQRELPFFLDFKYHYDKFLLDLAPDTTDLRPYIEAAQ